VGAIFHPDAGWTLPNLTWRPRLLVFYPYATHLIGWEGKSVSGILGLSIDVVDVYDRDGLVRKEVVGSFVEDMGGEVAHNWL
jgi:hypothetical protein